MTAVLRALTGTPLVEAAKHVDMEPTELEVAIDVFRQAGTRALEQQATAPGWWQIYVEFSDWPNSEATAATHLATLLDRSAAEWWFIRKHPCWRIRLRLRGRPENMKAAVSTALDALTAADHIERWWTGVYEPESAAFGGAEGMAAAHRLFHVDSRAILTRLHGRRHSPGRRELSVLLCTALMRGAGLEWYEQGDVWHQVAVERPLPADATAERLRPMPVQLKKLLLADLHPDGPLFAEGSPVSYATDWVSAFHSTGRALGDAARQGRLQRGVRRTLAYHVIFHWNRMGLPARTQSFLSWAAYEAVLNTKDTAGR
ncbi:thiopeptide-type bacteriocin biosynthesis protein [Streptomyces uncialis]|uniref:thiopeptide-type bacteriocin biosynthesis protein n=1 Tax=Streptomyces uncialis TaxID=1048205 RepID=UPI00224DB400|nr:thiopeptide-type bacteriocin biosynthesis protein [Streptomyces uncialis]MCX4661132.1 thiopeptide-type bacteriocin biosynthesis protein [Streptomyces uncialis]